MPAGGLSLLLVGEQSVERLARVDQELARLLDLGVRAGLGDLDRRGGELADEPAQRQPVLADLAAEVRPRLAELLAVGLDVLAARVGEREDLAALCLLGDDQALVL